MVRPKFQIVMYKLHMWPVCFRASIKTFEHDGFCFSLQSTCHPYLACTFGFLSPSIIRIQNKFVFSLVKKLAMYIGAVAPHNP